MGRPSARRSWASASSAWTAAASPSCAFSSVVGGIASALDIKYGNFAGYLVTLVDALMIFGAASRCLHDLIADTQVVTAESSPNATLEGSRRH
jgi:hypothetical protein